MDSKTFNKLSSEILTLSEAKRAELAHELIKSLDAPEYPNDKEAWDREIKHRLAEIDAGTASLIDRKEFQHRLQDRIGSH